MSEPRLVLKVNLYHDVRNDQRDTEKVTSGLLAFLNEQAVSARIETKDELSADVQSEEIVGHPFESDKNAEAIRIAVGHRASGVYVELQPKRYSDTRIERMVKNVVNELERQKYASNIKLDDWLIEATEQGKRV